MRSAVRVCPGPPFWLDLAEIGTVGAVAQLGEHLLCKQGVSGSIPLSSTNSIGVELTDISLEEKIGLHLAIRHVPVLHTL